MTQSDNRLVALAFLGMFAIGLTAGLMGVAWPSMRDTFGVGDDAYGALSMVATTGVLIVTLNSGRLIARLGSGPLLTSSCLVGALGFLGYALALSWWILVALGLAAVPALAGVLVERVGAGSVGPYLFAVAVGMVALNEAVERAASASGVAGAVAFGAATHTNVAAVSIPRL